jgi:hypothetical protein
VAYTAHAPELQIAPGRQSFPDRRRQRPRSRRLELRPLPARRPREVCFLLSFPISMDHLSALFVLCYHSTARVPPPARAATSITGLVPMSRRPHLRLLIMAAELEGHPWSRSSRSATRASSSARTASHG